MRLQTRPITEKEIDICKQFQQFLIPVLNFNKKRYIELEDAVQLNEALTKFKSLEYAQPILESLKEYFDAGKRNVSLLNSVVKKIKSDTIELDKAIKKFESGDFNFHLDVVDYEHASSHLSNTFLERSGAASFFSGGKTDKLLESFTKTDMEQVIDKKIKGQTYLNLKDSSDWEKIVFFIKNLTTKKEVNVTDAESWLKYNETPERKRLFKLVEDYQFNNDKREIAEIVRLIKADPDICVLNEKYTKIKVVYRGIASNELIAVKDIVKEDLRQRFVSVTPIEKVAQRFAERRGHMDTEANSKHSYIITYKCKPGAVLFSTDLFGRAYNEVDYVLDTTKAKATVTKTR